MRAKYFFTTFLQSMTCSMLVLSLTLVWDKSLSVVPTSGTNSPGFFKVAFPPEISLLAGNLG